MPRDLRAHLADIVDACNAILEAISGLDLSAYQKNRLIRSSVHPLSANSLLPEKQ